MTYRAPDAEATFIHRVHPHPHGAQFPLHLTKGQPHEIPERADQTVIIPHPRKDIPIGTLRSMIRQSGLPGELFD